MREALAEAFGGRHFDHARRGADARGDVDEAADAREDRRGSFRPRFQQREAEGLGARRNHHERGLGDQGAGAIGRDAPHEVNARIVRREGAHLVGERDVHRGAREDEVQVARSVAEERAHAEVLPLGAL